MHSLTRRLLVLLALALVPLSVARAQLTIEIVGGAGTTIPVSIVPFEGESSFPLGITGGWLLYLGYHALHEEWRRRGAPAFVSALCGVVGAAIIQQVLE